LIQDYQNLINIRLALHWYVTQPGHSLEISKLYMGIIIIF